MTATDPMPSAGTAFEDSDVDGSDVDGSEVYGSDVDGSKAHGSEVDGVALPGSVPDRDQDVSDDPPAGLEVLVRRSDPGLPLPAYAQPSDAGADLVTAEDVILAPGERAIVGTGLSIALPAGFAAFVHPRSGLAARHGLSVVNAPGTVDAGYRGEIKVILINTDRSGVITLRRGDRIAQLVVQRVEHAIFREVDQLPESVRGTGGFGSTGGFGPASGRGPRREDHGVRSRS